MFKVSVPYDLVALASTFRSPRFFYLFHEITNISSTRYDLLVQMNYFKKNVIFWVGPIEIL